MRGGGSPLYLPSSPPKPPFNPSTSSGHRMLRNHRGCPYTSRRVFGTGGFSDEDTRSALRRRMWFGVYKGGRRAGDRDRTGDLVLGKHTL